MMSKPSICTAVGGLPEVTRARTDVHVQGLGFGVVLRCEAPQLAADAALAIAAERKLGVAFEEGVHPDRAGADAARRLEAGAEVAAPDRGRQSVQRRVRELDGF